MHTDRTKLLSGSYPCCSEKSGISLQMRILPNPMEMRSIEFFSPPDFMFYGWPGPAMWGSSAFIGGYIPLHVLRERSPEPVEWPVPALPDRLELLPSAH